MLSAGLALLACGRPAPVSDLNVLLIALDTVRPDHLSHRGHPAPTSPRLDALAAEAISFEDAYSPSPWTAPALHSLMTSLYPEVHGVYRFPNPGRMDASIETLAEVLQGAGYATAAFTEGGYAKGAFGLDRGFDHYPLNPGDEDSHGSNLHYPSRIEGNVDRALAWLARAEAAPFFLFFHTYEAHFPYRAPEETIRRFRRGYASQKERAALLAIAAEWKQKKSLPAEAWDRLIVHALHCQLRELPTLEQHPLLLAKIKGRMRAFETGRVELGVDALEFARSLYDAELHYADAQIGRLLDGLAASSAGEKTVVVVVSDHGEGLGEHRRIQHGTNLHDELTRVLLLFHVPGQDSRRVTQLVRSLDVMPTILDLIEIQEPDLNLQGTSLLPLMQGGSDDRLAYSSARSIPHGELRMHSLRSDRWALHWDQKTRETRLFDRRADRGELTDVAEHRPDEVDRLRRALIATINENVGRSRGKAAAEAALPEGSEAELRALGYIE